MEIGFGNGTRFVAYSPIEDKARMYLSADGMEMKVFQNGKHIYFSRTTEVKMAGFDSSKASCIEKWKKHGVNKGDIADEPSEDEDWGHADEEGEDSIVIK